MEFQKCRLLFQNVWNRKLTPVQSRILRRLKVRNRALLRNLSARRNLTCYIQLQTTRKLALFDAANLPATIPTSRKKTRRHPSLHALKHLLILSCHRKGSVQQYRTFSTQVLDDDSYDSAQESTIKKKRRKARPSKAPHVGALILNQARFKASKTPFVYAGALAMITPDYPALPPRVSIHLGQRITTTLDPRERAESITREVLRNLLLSYGASRRVQQLYVPNDLKVILNQPGFPYFTGYRAKGVSVGNRLTEVLIIDARFVPERNVIRLRDFWYALDPRNDLGITKPGPVSTFRELRSIKKIREQMEAFVLKIYATINPTYQGKQVSYLQDFKSDSSDSKSNEEQPRVKSEAMFSAKEDTEHRKGS